MNQVVIVIGASARLSDVFVFFLGCHGHGTLPSQYEASKAVEQIQQHTPPKSSPTKTPTCQNTRRYSVTSVYCSTSLRRGGLLFV
jgi:hypothetical protein